MIFLLLIITTVISQDCPQYKCKSKKQKFTNSTCIAYIEGIYYISPCSSGVCQMSLGYRNSTCMPESTSDLSIAYPGEKCSKDSDCDSNLCKENICKGSAKGKKCITNTDCNSGLYCNNGICDKLFSIGDTGCTDDFQCENHAACNITESTGTCFKYFSLNPGEIVATCSSQNYNFLCTSGLCGTYNNGLFVCLNDVKNSIPNPYICSPNSKCESIPDSITGTILTADCDCGLGTGSAYCNLFFGDDYANEYLQNLKAWMSSKEILNCNTNVRFSTECIKA